MKDDLILQGISRFPVGLLVVDDDPPVVRSLRSVFSCPAFEITSAESYESACEQITSNSDNWHCWIVDIDLGSSRNGIDIISRFLNFPFIVVLSGLQSMQLASEAIQKGAMHVLDKSPDLLDRLHDTVCKTCALSHVLGRKQSKYLPTYRLLEKSVIKSPEEWAEQACVSIRQLHRICDLHAVSGIRATLSAFYGMYYLLCEGTVEGDTEYFHSCLKDLLGNDSE